MTVRLVSKEFVQIRLDEIQGEIADVLRSMRDGKEGLFDKERLSALRKIQEELIEEAKFIMNKG